MSAKALRFFVALRLCAADSLILERQVGPVIERIVSGGQTGVDRAALDVALQAGVPCGGWCPLGRRAEDGRIPDRYPLIETSERDYSIRTERNIIDSDATLIISGGPLTGGTALTRNLARRLGSPLFIVDLREYESAKPNLLGATVLDQLEQWLTENRIHTLNVAGPRESQQPGIYARASQLLRQLFSRIANSSSRPV
ncbi:molybdenum cofactor carrier [bacterium]|nr:molybdenum cofactor carrier [bacterium]